jgi:hypothetical protein
MQNDVDEEWISYVRINTDDLPLILSTCVVKVGKKCWINFVCSDKSDVH